jgi:hypothetical protein
LIYEPLLSGRCEFVGSPGAQLLQISTESANVQDMRFANVGVQRKFDLLADRWYGVRMRRDPERLRVWVDGAPVIDESIPNVELPNLGLQGSWSKPGDEVRFADFEIRAPAKVSKP